jgi:hypothetical protein
MSQQKIFESLVVDGVELYHTYRGYNGDIEVYGYSLSNRTFSLFKRPGDNTWRADWTTSYDNQPIELEADATNKDAMLKAFAAYLKTVDPYDPFGNH